MMTALDIFVHNTLACAYTNLLLCMFCMHKYITEYMYMHDIRVMYSINVFHVVNAIEIFVHITLACAHTNTYERYMHTDVHTQTYSVNT